MSVPPWDYQWRETGLRRFYAAKDTVDSAKGIAKTMLIDRLQSLIAVIILNAFSRLNHNKFKIQELCYYTEINFFALQKLRPKAVPINMLIKY
ncbi:Uncharacterized protein FWK35_00000240 [Aphis craccivora]|uniref:Uncharacterized protein n=1 Tax=Aphis craccivora TaxID=307492 RepID=A0A6G0ZQ85_APHCR|nr:Uncharacterized protein FWK35_00000240 [Aphis craccivora]